MANQLAGETSPYLLQHAANPVHWVPWSQAALARARDEDKPILLSVGYSACHWCHVMAHESFEDAGIAEVMNRLFVNIKVDREERPDLDQIYQLAHQMLTQRSGGWPLTLFLTPDGMPFFGGTYFPKQPRYGLPGFGDLCERVGRAWREQRAAIDTQNAELREAMQRLNPPAGYEDDDFDAGPVAAARDALAAGFDAAHGGFGHAPKFPHAPELAFLQQRQLSAGDAKAGEMLLATLRGMAAGGIHDHLGGGFCRYSVDERWEIPHFEKMLYDNGPLLGLYARAWAGTGDEQLAAAAEGIATFVMRELQAPGGGYYSALDADSEGHEGKFYVWTPDQLEPLLSVDERVAVGLRYGLKDAPNFERSFWHLKIARSLGEVAAAMQRDEAAVAALIAAARAKMFAAREQRVRPGCDDKVLASWNALMIEGMALAARLMDRPDWLRSAQRAADHLHAVHWRDARLLATSKGGRAHLNGYLDDYAFLIAALLELLQAEFVPRYLGWAQELADALLTYFEDARHGGFHFTSHDHETLIVRSMNAQDNATPSGNGVAALALTKLGHLVGNQRYLDAGRNVLARFRTLLANHPAGCSSLVAALEQILCAPRIVLLCGPAEALSQWRGARRGARPDTLTFALPNGTPDLPATLTRPEAGVVNAWVCLGVKCLPPVDRPAELERILSQ
ncbi:MAG: thioredoxin domain-containing protein [Rhodocyclaceae bacterium]|nr:thioredoxin domain-containing protein [Rhodocyclaceae bacterium]MBX3668715.1 thioredoxin domain-containing protein [Rhodocyclaceae bacterium]